MDLALKLFPLPAMGNGYSDCACEHDVDAGCEDLERCTVFINIYDLNRDWLTANKVGKKLLNMGAFHAAVEVYGHEWSYGCEGVERAEPRRHEVHIYRQSVNMGPTSMSEIEVNKIIEAMKPFWLAHEYDLLQHNRCSFADAFSQELTQRPLPPWVNRLPRLLSNVDLVSPKFSRSVSRATFRLEDDEGEHDESPKMDAVDTYPSLDSRTASNLANV